MQDKFTGEWIKLDEEDARPSQFHQTWVFRLVGAVVNRFTGRHEDVLGEVEEEGDEQKEEVGREVAKKEKGKKGGSKKNK